MSNNTRNWIMVAMLGLCTIAFAIYVYKYEPVIQQETKHAQSNGVQIDTLQCGEHTIVYQGVIKVKLSGASQDFFSFYTIDGHDFFISNSTQPVHSPSCKACRIQNYIYSNIIR